MSTQEETTTAAPFSIAGSELAPGEQHRLELPLARLTSGTRIGLPLLVIHGRRPGRAMWLTAAVHGDEIAGVEIIRRVTAGLDPETMAGTLVAAPVVNVHGFNTSDRYLPDRRDLNRSFPGSPRGSLAAQIAHLVMTEIVGRCGVGIDLHTGSDHRINLPQIRANLKDPATAELAAAFGPPVAMHSRTRDGSLRQAATDAGATVLLYEGGEAMRFDDRTIEAGTTGVLRVMQHLGMVEGVRSPAGDVVFSERSRWVRATRSGVVQLAVGLGETLEKGDDLAVIHDTFGVRRATMRAPFRGMVIGHTQQPLVNRGDAIAHLAVV